MITTTRRPAMRRPVAIEMRVAVAVEDGSTVIRLVHD